MSFCTVLLCYVRVNNGDQKLVSSINMDCMTHFPNCIVKALVRVNKSDFFSTTLA